MPKELRNPAVMLCEKTYQVDWPQKPWIIIVDVFNAHAQMDERGSTLWKPKILGNDCDVDPRWTTRWRQTLAVNA